MEELTDKMSKNERILHMALAIFALLVLAFINIYIIFIENRALGFITTLITLLGVLFFILWIWSSLQRLELSRNLTLLFIVSVFSVLLVEKTLEYIDFMPAYEDRKAQYTYRRINALNNELDNVRNAHIRIPPKLKQYGKNLFLSDITNEVTIFGEEDDGMIIFKSDENGFRNSNDSYNDFDVLLLGDSFAESSFVTEDETIHYNLIENGYKTYNAGVGSAGLAHSLAVFIEYGIPKKPKFVILNIVEGSSISRMHRELKKTKFMEYYKTHNSKNILFKKAIQNDTLRYLFNRELIRSYSLILGDVVGINNHPKNTSLLIDYIPRITRALELLKGTIGLSVTYKGEGVPVCSDVGISKLRLENILKFIQDKTKSFEGHFAVSYLGAARFPAYSWDNCEYDMVKSLLDDLKIPLIDMVEEFNKSDNPSKYFANNFYRKDIYGHYNSIGYKAVSDKITYYLDSINAEN